MKFIDEAKIYVKAGDGGNGVAIILGDAARQAVFKDVFLDRVSQVMTGINKSNNPAIRKLVGV